MRVTEDLLVDAITTAFCDGVLHTHEFPTMTVGECMAISRETILDNVRAIINKRNRMVQHKC